MAALHQDRSTRRPAARCLAAGRRRVARAFTRLALGALAATATTLLLAPADPASAGPYAGGSRTVPAREVVRHARAGEAINLSGATIEGDLDLRRVGSVAEPLRCVGCIFRGSLNATDVIFERAVDLTDSEVAGSVDLTGSVFRDHVTLEGTRFHGPVTATSVRMMDTVSFAKARFHGPAVFDRARLKGQARFAGSAFQGDAEFRGTEFESKADFAGTTFHSADFEGAIFQGHASFSNATFMGEAEFDGAELAGGGNFRAAQFESSARFNRISAGKDLTFHSAVVMADGNFHRITGSGLFSLVGLRLGDGGQLLISDVASSEFSMDVKTIVRQVRGGKKDLLAQLEESAEARNELSVANQARFARLSLQGDKKHGFERVTDQVYRNVLGYLVRPRRPFVAFGLLILAAGLIRVLPETGRFLLGVARRSQRRHPARAHGLSDRLCSFLHPLALACRGWATSLSSAFGRKPPNAVLGKHDGPEYARAAVLWTEFLLYKALIAVFLLSLSNANSTARDILYNVWSS